MINELFGSEKLLKGIELIRSGNILSLTKGQINLYKQVAELSDLEISEYISESKKTPNVKGLLSWSKKRYIQKGYKVKLLPTDEQKILLSKHVGAWRFLYNWLYAKRRDVYINYYAEVFRAKSNFFFKNKNTKKKFKPHKIPIWKASYNMIKKAKENKELPEWLSEINSNVINALCKVYPNKPSGFRKKSKSKKSFTNYQGNTIKIEFDKINNKGYIIIPIIGKLEHNRTDFIPINRKICSIGISFFNNDWYASVVVREGDKPELRTEGKIKGIDVGCRKLAVCFDGEKYSVYGCSKNTKEEHADKLIKLQKELAKWQRRASRRFKKDSKEQSKRYEFAINITRSIHKRIADCRNDNLHQVSHRIFK